MLSFFTTSVLLQEIAFLQIFINAGLGRPSLISRKHILWVLLLRKETFEYAFL